MDIYKFSQVMQQKFLEFSNLFLNITPNTPGTPPSMWTPPPLGWIEVNVDAAQLGVKASLTLIARDHRGEVIGVWGQCQSIKSPLQAEVAALQWAVETTKREKW